ncbi:MAG TPA: hypothetical protein VHC71_04555 [Hyphomicrobium sp.]|nr:hypothetical protein [Hyphomicrobium sp.]
MIDLGLSGLVDRFEKTFGTLITNFLLGLIGLTVGVVCIGLMATYLIPTFLFLVDDQLGAKYTYYSGAIAYLGLTVFFVWHITSSIGTAIEKRAVIREAREFNSDTRQLYNEVEENLAKSEKALEESRQLYVALKNLAENNPVIREALSDLETKMQHEEQEASASVELPYNAQS